MTEWIIKIKRTEIIQVSVSAKNEEEAKQKARTEQSRENMTIEVTDAKLDMTGKEWMM